MADRGNNRVEKFTSTGTYITAWGCFNAGTLGCAGGTGNGVFSGPQGIAVDSAGNVYVSDDNNFRVEKFTSAGNYITAWGCLTAGIGCAGGSGNGEFIHPNGVAVDSSGNVYVVDHNNYRVEKFTSTGTYILQWGSGPGSGNSQFTSPFDVAVDSLGNVYVTDSGGGNNRVQKFTSTGSYITQWGVAGPGDGQFISAEGVAVDSGGNVYVADSGNNRVQKFTNTGTFILKWGSGPSSAPGLFDLPNGVAVDASGNVYVADQGNNRFELFGDVASATIPLVAGWNLISFPLVPVNTATAKVLNDLIVAKNLTIVWSFQAGVWKSFTPPSTGTLTTMVDGLGYWILVTKPSRIIVLGYVIVPALAPPSYSLSVGWNLIGFKPQPDPTASENVAFYLQSITTKYDNNAVWTYNNGASTWTRATCDYAPGGIGTCAQNLTPGQGLWVYMKTAATLSP